MFRLRRALVVFTLFCLAFPACKKKRTSDEPELPTVTGDGVSAAQARTLPSFTRLDVKGAFDVTVSVDKDEPLELHGDQNLFVHVKSNVANGELTLEPDAVLKPSQAFRISVGTAHLDAVGAGVAAKITVHAVNSEVFSVRTGGAAQVTADGSSTELSVGSKTASRVDLRALSAARASVTAVDFARVELGYVEKLEATQHSFGTILYSGSPEITVHADRPQNVGPRK